MEYKRKTPEGKKRKADENEIKDRYRAYFLAVKPYLSFGPAFEKTSIHQPNFSSFLNGSNAAMKIENLEKMRSYCESVVEEMQNARDALKEVQ